MDIKLTPEEREEFFYNALCNGAGSCIANNGGLRCNDEEYAKAKAKLLKAKPNAALCFEDVWMQVLRDGGSLQYVDPEDDSLNSTVTMKEVHERMELVPARHLLDMKEEQDDGETADAILQTVLFKEIVFG